MTDTEILLQTFLGSALAQAVTAELGEGIIGMAYMQGSVDNHERIMSGGDGIDHLAMAKEHEEAIDGLFIGSDDEPAWEPIEDDFDGIA